MLASRAIKVGYVRIMLVQRPMRLDMEMFKTYMGIAPQIMKKFFQETVL